MIAILLAPLPTLIVLLLVIIAALPWGPFAANLAAAVGDIPLLAKESIGDAVTLETALLPVGAIFYWSAHRTRLMPAIVVLISGLCLDVVTQSPLGVWGAVALVAGFAGRQARAARDKLGWLRRGLFAIASIATCSLLSVMLLGLAAWKSIPLTELALAVILAVIAYPALATLLALCSKLWPEAPSRALFLRGD
jgi:hypothetical protein